VSGHVGIVVRMILGRQPGNINTPEECEVLLYKGAGFPQFADSAVDIDGWIGSHLEALLSGDAAVALRRTPLHR
jgi:hypothetical protein